MRRASIRAIAVLLIALGAAVGTSGCAAPTLPLPPPQIDSISAPDAMGMVTVTGLGNSGGALIMVFNQDLDQGVITVADPDTRAFTARLAGQSGHTISVWQRKGTDTSASVDRTVP